MPAIPSFIPLAATHTFGWQEVLILLACYVAGATPFGLLIGKMRGIDIREHGSGNIGATNVLRVLGKPVGICVLILDIIKGLLPVLIVSHFSSGDLFPILAGLATILGHNYTFWLKFKGGKGIATSAGVLAVLIPIPLVIAIAAWIIAFFASRYVSVASIAAAISLPISTPILESLQDDGFNWALVILTVIMAVLAIWRHRGNIRRLAAGEESRFQPKSKKKEPS